MQTLTYLVVEHVHALSLLCTQPRTSLRPWSAAGTPLSALAGWQVVDMDGITEDRTWRIEW